MGTMTTRRRCLPRFDCQAAGEQEHAITQKTQNLIVLCFTVKLGTLFASWSAASPRFLGGAKKLSCSSVRSSKSNFMLWREVQKMRWSAAELKLIALLQ
jgi:hypothetical protein